MDAPVPLGGTPAVEGAGGADERDAHPTLNPAEPSPRPAEFTPRRAPAEPDAGDLQERDLVAFIARGLVDHPDDVAVEILNPGSEASFELHVHPDDLGHVIGKMGRTARSMRLVLGAAAARLGRGANLEIAD